MGNLQDALRVDVNVSWFCVCTKQIAATRNEAHFFRHYESFSLAIEQAELTPTTCRRKVKNRRMDSQWQCSDSGAEWKPRSKRWDWDEKKVLTEMKPNYFQ